MSFFSFNNSAKDASGKEGTSSKSESQACLGAHQHGKSRVRVARVWRLADGMNYFAEYQVETTLISAMEHAYLDGSNEGMTATDTQKNTCYYVAQQMDKPCSVEEYALALGRHFVKEYPLVSTAIIGVEQKPWKRVTVSNQPHNHGFATTGEEIRTTTVEVHRAGHYEIVSGFKDLKLCKTTQSGYEGFLHDRYTLLPDTRERLLASSITASWSYSKGTTYSFDKEYEAVKAKMVEAFFGHPKTGVYSPSVQKTLYEMGEAVINSCQAVEWVQLYMPNLHFNPLSPVTSKFNDDVYFPTSEPHGTIKATIKRKHTSKL